MKAGSLHVDISGDDSKLQKVLQRVNAGFMKIPDTIERSIGKIGHLEAKLDKVAKGTNWNRSAAAFDKLGKGMMTAGAAGVGLNVVLGTVVANFEKIMTEAAAVSGKKEGFTEAFNSMSDAAIRLSQTTKYTAYEIGQAFKFLSMAGQNATTSIGAMPHVLRLAAASGVELGRSADIVTNIMASYGKSAEQMGDVNNVLIGTFANSNVSLEQLSESFRTAGSMANTVKVPIEQLAATLGVLGNAGEQGAFSGQGLKMAIAQIVGPTKQGAEALSQLGVSAGLLQSKGFLGVVKAIENSTKSMRALGNSTKVAELIIQAFGARAGPRMAVLLNQGSEKIAELMGQIEKAKDQDLAAFIEEKQLATLSGAFDLLKSSIDAFALSIGQRLLPFFKALFKALKGISDGFNSLPSVVKDGIAIFAAAAGVAGVLALAIGSLSFALGASIGPMVMFSKMTGMSITVALTKATVAVKSFVVALSSKLLVALAGFAAGFGAMYGLMNLFGVGLKENQSLMDELGYAFDTAFGSWPGLLRVAGQALIAFGSVLLKVVIAPLMLIPPLFAAASESIDEMAMSLNDSLIEATKEVEQLTSATNKTNDEIKKLKKESGFDDVTKQIGNMVEGMEDMGKTTGRVVDHFAKLKKAVNEVVRDWTLKSIDFEIRGVVDVGLDIERDIEKISDKAKKAFKKFKVADPDELFRKINETVKNFGGLEKFYREQNFFGGFVDSAGKAAAVTIDDVSKKVADQLNETDYKLVFKPEFKGIDRNSAKDLRETLQALLDQFSQTVKSQELAVKFNAQIQLELDKANVAIFEGMVTQLGVALSDVPMDKFSAALSLASDSIDRYVDKVGSEEFIKIAKNSLSAMVYYTEGLEGELGKLPESLQTFKNELMDIDFSSLGEDELFAAISSLEDVIRDRAVELSQIFRDQKFLRENLPELESEKINLEEIVEAGRQGKFVAGEFSSLANKTTELEYALDALRRKFLQEGKSSEAAGKVLEKKQELELTRVQVDAGAILREALEENIQIKIELDGIIKGLTEWEQIAVSSSRNIEVAAKNLKRAFVDTETAAEIISAKNTKAAMEVSKSFLEANSVTRDFRKNLPSVQAALELLGDEGKAAAKALAEIGPPSLRFEDIESIPVRTIQEKITESLQRAIIAAGEDVTGLTREEAKFSGEQLSEALFGAIKGESIDFGPILEQNAPAIAKGITGGLGSIIDNASKFIAGTMPGGTAPLLAGLKAAGTAVAGATAGLSAAIAAIPVVGMVIAGFAMLFDTVKSALQSLVGSMIPEERLSKAAEAGTGAAVMSALLVIPIANALSLLAVIATGFAITIASAVALLLPVIILLSPLLIGLAAATIAVSAAVLAVVGVILMLGAYINGLIHGPLVVFYSAIMMVVGGAMLLFGLIGAVAALIPETENFKRAMSALEQVADNVISVINNAFGDVLMMGVGLFSKTIEALIPIIEIFAAGLASFAPILFEAMKQMALFFLDTVIAGVPFFNFLMDLGTVIGQVFGYIARAGEYLIGAFTEGAKVFFEIIKFFGEISGNADLVQSMDGFINGVDNFQGGVTTLVDSIFSAADALQNFKIDDNAVAALRTGRDEVARLTADLATEEGNRLAAEKDAADKLTDMNEQLTNVPQGFKVAAARYNAIAVDDSRSTGRVLGSDDESEAVSAQSVVNNYSIALAVSNWNEFLDQLDKETRRRELQRSSVIRFNDGLYNGGA